MSLSALSVFDQAGDYIYVKNANLRFLYANWSMAKLFGLEQPAKLLGLTDADLVPGNLAEGYRQDDLLVLRGQSVRREIEWLSRDGIEFFRHQTSKEPLRNGAGEVCGIIGVTRSLGRKASKLPEPVGKAVEEILRNLRVRLPIMELARQANMSLSAFERRFKAEVGMTPRNFEKHVRVTRASRELLESNMPLVDIALRHGYCDQSHFTREFRRTFGTTPARYRRRFRQAAMRNSL